MISGPINILFRVLIMRPRRLGRVYTSFHATGKNGRRTSAARRAAAGGCPQRIEEDMSDPAFTHHCSICGAEYSSKEQFPAHQVCPKCMGAPGEAIGRPARSNEDKEKRKKEKKKAKEAKKARKRNRGK